jgi:hypothetical protein
VNVAAHVPLMAGEQIVAQYYARKLTPRFRVLLFIVLLLCVVLPGLIYLIWFFLAPRYHGFVALTTRRVVYLEFGKRFMGGGWTASSFDLGSIASVECYTQHGVKYLLGLVLWKESKALLLELQSRYPVRLVIGGITALASNLFAPAADSVTMAQEIGARVLDLQQRLQSREG